MKGALIFPAAAADHPELLEIWLAASRAGHPFLGEEILSQQIPKMLDVYLPNTDVWVASSARHLGFIGLIGSHVGGLFVHPNSHRQGIGRMLLKHAADRLGKLTVDVYEANQAAVAFYNVQGFVQFDRTEQDDEGRPFPLLRMRRVEGDYQTLPNVEEVVEGA